MKPRKKHISALIFVLFFLSSVLYAGAGDTDYQYFSQKEELLILYEKILTQGQHVYPFDLYGDIHWYAVEEDPYASFGVGLLFRPFASKPYQHKRTFRLHQLYEETKVQTGISLTVKAEEEMKKIIDDILEWENRAWWRRVVLLGGHNIPFALPDFDYRDNHWYVSAGYEIWEDTVISAGISLEESPALTIACSYTFFSDVYAGAAYLMERVENTLTTQRVYHNQ